MAAVIFALVALGLLIYGIEYTIHARDKYKKLEEIKKKEPVEQRMRIEQTLHLSGHDNQILV